MNARTSTHPLSSGAKPHPRLRWVTLAVFAAAMLLMVITPQISAGAALLLAAILCFAVFSAGLFLQPKQPESPWPAARHLVLLGLWMIADWQWAGVLLAAALGLNAAIRRLFPAFASPAALRELRGVALSSLALLLAAEAGCLILAAERPFNPSEGGLLLRFTAAAAGGWLAAHAVARWDAVDQRTAAPFFSVDALNLYFFLLGIALAAVYVGAGVGAFAIMLLLLARYALQQQISGGVAQRSQELRSQNEMLVRKLSLVNETVDNALFGQERPAAVKTACETALAIAHADRAAIFLLDRETNTLHLAESIGFTPQEISAGQGLPYILEDARIVPDTALDERPGVLAACLRRSRAYAQLPLRNGPLAHGYLLVAYDQPRPLPSSEIEVLVALAKQMAAALDNDELLEALEQHAFELSHLLYLSRIFSSGSKLDQLGVEVADVLRQISDMDWSLLALTEEQKPDLRVMGVSSGTAEDEQDFAPYSLQLPPELAALRQERLPPPRVFQRDETHSTALALLMQQQRLHTLIAAPLLARQQFLGIILLGAQQPRSLNMREEQLLRTAVRQLAIQIDNLRRYEQTYANLEHRLRQLAVIEDIAQRISSSHDFNAIIKDVFEAALNSTGADMVDLALLTEAQDWWVIEEYREGGESRRRFFNMPLDEGVIGLARRTGQVILVPDNTRSAEYSPSPLADYRSSLAIPLKRNDQEVIGVLNIESKQLNFFNLDQADFLRNLGGHAIISIENTNLLDTLRHQIDLLTGLRALSLTIASTTDTEAVARAVLNTALNLLDGQFAILFGCDEQSPQPEVIAQIERDGAHRVSGRNLAFMQVARQAATTGEAQAVEDVLQVYPEHAVDGVAYPSVIAVPIARGGKVRHVLCVAFEAERRLEEREINMVTQLAIQASGHLHNAELHERILENNSRMRAILDSTRDGMVLLDDRGRLIEVNPAAQRLIGINLSDHLNEPFVETLLRYIESDDDQSAGYSREELKKLARIQRLEPVGITRREFARQVPPNSVIYVEEIGSPVLDEHEHLYGRLLTLRDITEEKLLESYREEISSMLVHDLRSPLAAIISAHRIALENLALPNGADTVRQSLEASLTSAERLMVLVNSLLDIRRGQKMTLERTSVSISELIESARRTLEATAQKYNIPVEIVVPPDLPPVNVDAEKIQRVLINLLDNALRFTPAGKPLRLSVEHQPERRKLCVCVADSGPGIPEKERERIFEQYWQVKENRPLRGSKGSGIGLTFCQKVLEAHGERIWVQSPGPLPGACFAFTLPVA